MNFAEQGAVANPVRQNPPSPAKGHGGTGRQLASVAELCLGR